MEESRAMRRHVDDVEDVEGACCDILVRNVGANASMVGMVVAAPRMRKEVIAVVAVIFMVTGTFVVFKNIFCSVGGEER